MAFQSCDKLRDPLNSIFLFALVPTYLTEVSRDESYRGQLAKGCFLFFLHALITALLLALRYLRNQPQFLLRRHRTVRIPRASLLSPLPLLMLLSHSCLFICVLVMFPFPLACVEKGEAPLRLPMLDSRDPSTIYRCSSLFPSFSVCASSKPLQVELMYINDNEFRGSWRLVMIIA